MSVEQQQTFSQALALAARRHATPIPSRELGLGARSFRRVLGVLGMSASVAAAWYGAFYLYQWYKKNFGKDLAGSTSEAFSIENNKVTTENLVAQSEDNANDESAITPELDYELRRKTVKVVLHQCPRGYYTPCIAPFPMKLETFLRVANIPFEIDFSYQPANRTSPWMTVDGVDVVESHECVPKLSKIFGINLEKSATQASRLTASRLVGIMLENHIYWGIALWRWVYDEGKSLRVIQPLSPVAQDVVTEVSASVIRASWYHGLGRLSKDQVIDLVLTDLADLSAALGNHDYFLGKTPGEVDCNAFAMLSQMVWNMPDSPFELALKKYPNLVNFVLRMREHYWPDWESLLQKPGDVELPDKLMYPTGEFQVSRMSVPENPAAGGTEETVLPSGNLSSVKSNSSKPGEPSNSNNAANVNAIPLPPPQSKTINFSGESLKQSGPQQSTSVQVPFAQNFHQAQNPQRLGSARQQNNYGPQQSVSQSRPKSQAYAPQPTQSYQGPVFPAMNTNNMVVNQDEKLLQQKQEHDAMIQQRLGHLNQQKKIAQFGGGYVQDPIVRQGYNPPEQQQYYQIDQAQIYQNPTHYNPSQVEYSGVSEQYDQFQQPGQVYMSNNPFLISPEQQVVIPPGYVLTPNNRLIHSSQLGNGYTSN